MSRLALGSTQFYFPRGKSAGAWSY